MTVLLSVIQKKNSNTLINFTMASHHYFNLTVNKKTKVFAQPAPHTISPDFDVIISDIPLDQVEHFPYLGCLLANKCTQKRIWNTKLELHMGHLECSFNNKDMNLTTKTMAYKAVLLSFQPCYIAANPG
uniref:Uncharacterized protein n=1 Tax=Octopus bimaculoides TaxID=37653 RepID=A0A0L8H6Z4_OCTBM